LVYRLKQNTADARRSFSTSPQRPVDLNKTDNSVVRRNDMMDLEAAAALEARRSVDKLYARAVPVSPSYFSRSPDFNDSYVALQDLARKYGRLPLIPKDKMAPTIWKTSEQYRQVGGENVKGRDYAECLKLAKQLNRIHPDLRPEEVTEGLKPFLRSTNAFKNEPRALPIDRFGRAHATGKRKSSVARAWVVEGTGEVLVNGKPLSEAFGRVHDRESAVWGLKISERMDKYNVWALVEGGGTTGQAEALALATAKALLIHEPGLKNTLRRGESCPLLRSLLPIDTH
jgi:small subunit ribosomal protein S9